jgi:SAM-dependent methyltransferase
VIGVAFLALAKAKNILKGYDRARPFSTDEVERCIAYDIKVVEEWLEVMRDYLGPSAEVRLRGARILELGPGADLGVALYLLSKGAAQYCAIDAFPLALAAPPQIHHAILDRIEQIGSKRPRAELERALVGVGSSQDAEARIRYVVRSDFKIAEAFAPNTFDIVFSQAAFEHFDDVESTIAQMSEVAKPGATLIAGIDMQTHSRWLREKDPLNIYRHGPIAYGIFRFRGMPNRVQTSEYQALLTKHGWTNVDMKVLGAVDAVEFDRVMPGLAPAYRKDETRNLWVMACATRAG